jgi:hypothetical protein|tara:strand:+ start:95 stop:904 length:810 start_codon:yes stop_codon:yes gene_type:complete
MKKTEKYLNFFGDNGNYKFHNPLPNPYGLRGNPDLNANSYDQGDGLNGTPDYKSFDGSSNKDMQDFEEWSNHPGFIGINWGGNKNNNEMVDIDSDGIDDSIDTEITASPATNYSVTEDTNTGGGGGFISAWFDGKKKYYKCVNGSPMSNLFKTGEQPVGWDTYKNPCLTATQRQDKKDNFWGGIGNALGGLTTGYKTGLNAYQPGGTTAPVFDPNATNNPSNNASFGTDTGKTVGWALVGLVGLGLIYMVIKGASSGGGVATDDYISRV